MVAQGNRSFFAAIEMARDARCHFGPSDFEGAKLHVVQVGLGDNKTFIQNLCGKDADLSDYHMDWLLRSVGETSLGHFSGIGVEPVPEHCLALKDVGNHLPRVALLQAALGDVDSVDSEIYTLTDENQEKAIRQVESAKKQQILQHHFQYLRNMSSVGGPHPWWTYFSAWIQQETGVTPQLSRLPVELLTWETMSKRYNFKGCRLLIIDAEGFDTRVLRGLIAYCKARKELHDWASYWPDVIQFETQGHCNEDAGAPSEDEALGLLQKEGYLLIHKSNLDSQLVFQPALSEREALQQWVDNIRCSECKYGGKYSYPLETKTTKRGEWSRHCCQKCLQKKEGRTPWIAWE